jgi:hypothetical protein
MTHQAAALYCHKSDFGISTPEHPASLQHQDELAAFIALLQARGVRSYLEIGARYGGTFERIMMALPRGSNGVALDFPGGPFGDDRSAEDLLACMCRLRKEGRDVRCVFGPSTAPEVFRRVRQRSGDPYGAVLIDGDHSYEGVSADWALYRNMGRIVALHDIAAPEGFANRAGQAVEVPRLWNEIKGTLDHTEIITENSIMGIGVVFNDGAPKPESTS